jgi:glutathione S-transferase
MNLQRRHSDFKVWPGAQADIDRIMSIWTECLTRYGGPWLFGTQPSMADAMYAPECTRILTYGVECDPLCRAYVDTVLDCPHLVAWMAEAEREPDDLTELEIEF